jgi:hypothetical protein
MATSVAIARADKKQVDRIQVDDARKEVRKVPF